MPQIGSLSTSLTLESNSFVVGLKKAAAQTQTSVSSIERNFNSMKNAAQIAFSALAAGEFISAGARALDYASSLQEVAQQIGVTSRDLQVYRYIATQVGLSQDDMEAGLTKLTKTIGEAAEGGKKQAATFKELGVAIVGANGQLLTAGDVMPRVADALAKIPDPARRAALEIDLFGKAGQKLDTLLAGGSGQIDNLRNAAERLGIVISDDLIEHADAAADKMAELKLVLEANLAATVAANADAIFKMVDSLAKLAATAPDAVRWMRDLRLAAGEYQSTIYSYIGGTPQFRASEGNRARSFRLQRAQLQDDELQARFGYGAGGYAGKLDRDRAALTAELQALGFVATPGRDLLGKVIVPGSGAGSTPRRSSGGGRSSGSSTEDPFAHIQQSIRDTVSNIGVTPVELGKIVFTLDRDSNASLRQLSDRYGVNLTATGDSLDEAQKVADAYLENMRDAQRQLDEERLRIEEQTQRSLAGVYENLFRNGTKGLWADFKQIGLQTIAEVAAAWTLSRITGKSFDLGSTVTGALSSFGFGGFFANGGEPPVGKASIVGERGPELFIPKVAGTIIPNGALGGRTVYQTFDLRGAVVTEQLYAQMNRIAAGHAQAALVAAPVISEQRMARRAASRLGR